MTSPTLDLTAAWVPLVVEPGDGISVPVTVPAGYEGGTWAATVWRDARRAVSLASFTVGVVGQVVTVTLTSATVAGLLPAGSVKLTGHWTLTRTAVSVQRTWVKGDFVIDARRERPATSVGALTLSITSGVVTAA